MRRPAQLALLLALVACGTRPVGSPAPDAGPSPDAGSPGSDAGPALDAGAPDAGAPDAGAPDAGPEDAGPPDAGPTDAGPTLDCTVNSVPGQCVDMATCLSVTETISSPSYCLSDPSLACCHLAPDAGSPQPDAGPDACSVGGTVGQCLDTTSCAAMAGYTSTPGYCPGPSNIQCCTLTPDTSANPPFPAGYQLMQQGQVTSEMTTWAVDILHDHLNYPMYSATTRYFGAQLVLAQVQWHPPDFQNSVVHRGVTLFVPQ